MQSPRKILAPLAAAMAPLIVFAHALAAPPAAKEPTEEEKTVKIALYPMPATRPALKYQLLPPLWQRRPGNAAVWWNRLPAQRLDFLNNLEKEGGLWEKVEQWLEMPIGSPQEKEYRQKERAVRDVALNRPLFSDMDYAARFESCDWELPIHEGKWMDLLLPEVQQARTWARLLSAKAHLEIAEGKYDEAVHTFQTGFSLARHVSHGPTLIHALVGAAIAGVMTQQVEQFVQQPDAPNLYWALATLPRPLVDFRPGLEGEMDSLYLTIPELKRVKEPAKEDLSAEQWRALLFDAVDRVVRWSGGERASGVAIAALALQGYPAAKQYLTEHGHSAAEVEAMPVAKAVLLHAVQVYEELRDDCFKWLYLPYPEFQKGYAEADAKLKQRASRQEAGIFLAALIVPATGAVKNAEARTWWVVARLQIFEALRIYAAAHDGQLPERLSDMSEVPVPLNPFEDKPFLYQRDGNRATLTNEHGPVKVPWRYEITMLSKGE